MHFDYFLYGAFFRTKNLPQNYLSIKESYQIARNSHHSKNQNKALALLSYFGIISCLFGN